MHPAPSAPTAADPGAAPRPSRRALLAAAPLLLAALAGPSFASPASATDAPPYVRGTALLPPSSSSAAVPPAAALYVTARPARPDNVPRAILDGGSGKAPPVLAARFAAPKFPFEFALTARDLTPEGAAAGGAGGATGVAAGPSWGAPWWAGEPLIVSARLDSDGVAATRDPTDLVGRGTCASAGEGSVVTLELGGRGLFGRAVTGRR